MTKTISKDITIIIPIQKAALILSDEYKLPTPQPIANNDATTKPIYRRVVFISSLA